MKQIIEHPDCGEQKSADKAAEPLQTPDGVSSPLPRNIPVDLRGVRVSAEIVGGKVQVRASIEDGKPVDRGTADATPREMDSVSGTGSADGTADLAYAGEAENSNDREPTAEQPPIFTQQELAKLLIASIEQVRANVPIVLRTILEEDYDVPSEPLTQGASQQLTSRERATYWGDIQVRRDAVARQLGFASYAVLQGAFMNDEYQFSTRLAVSILARSRTTAQTFDPDLIKGYIWSILRELKKGESLRQAINACQI